MEREYFLLLSLFICFIFCLSCYRYFYHKENMLLKRLMHLMDEAEAGTLVHREISEEKVSAFENRLKKYLETTLLESGSQRQQKEIIQGLISDIAHQTLTPIANLKIYASLLQETADDKAGLIETIQEQTDRLDFQIQSLVKLSRMESGMIEVHPKEDRIQRLFDAVYKEYANIAAQKNITLDFRQTDLAAVFDLKWTVEAVGNMIDNGIKYTPSSGRVTMTAAVNTFFVRIDIADNGIGIAQEECVKIFSRFYRSFDTADEPGVGIGLYLAREFIRLQKGYVTVKSKKGQGCVFSVFLPAVGYNKTVTFEKPDRDISMIESVL